MLVPLSSLYLGSEAKIVELNFDETLKDRFLSMGMIPGKKVLLAHESPFKDPLVYKIDDNKIMLRKSEASKILVEVSEEITSLNELSVGSYTFFAFEGLILLNLKIKTLKLETGDKLEVIESNSHNMVIKAKNTELVIDKKTAKKILCKIKN